MRPGGVAIILIRGTKKLLKRLETEPDELKASTNALGDWYANLVYVGRNQYVLCTSANSLLSVVFEAKQVKTRIREQLCAGLEALLLDLGVAEPRIRAELKEMTDCRFGPTASPSILGTMNEFAFNIRYKLCEQPDLPMRQINQLLSETPSKIPFGYTFPNQRARMLLENWHREAGPTTQ
jgi:hypothetical protein